ncbi:MAG: hypothetical protein V1743_05635 [Nanoarchaeota archaeon]
MGSKKEKKEILSSIKESVMQSPKSMYELAKELGSNWDTIKNNVSLLKELGIVDIQNQKVIFMNNKMINETTFAGLPSSISVRRKVLSLGQMFLKEWKNVTNRRLCSTILQKAMVEIADTFPKLKIPRGWYLYGKVVLIKMSEEILSKEKYEYDFSSELTDVNKLKSLIKNLALRYSKMTTDQVVQEQYQNHKSELYVAKNKVEKILYSNNIDFNVLIKELYEMVFFFDLDKEDDLSLDMFATFKDGISVMIDLIKNKNMAKNLKSMLIDLFKSLWKLAANYNLYRTYEGELGYDNAVIKSFVKETSQYLKSEFLDQVTVTA